MGPLSKTRELFTTPPQQMLAPNRVERIFKVKLEKALALAVGLPFGPSPACMHSTINAKRARHTDLVGFKKGSGLLFGIGA